MVAPRGCSCHTSIFGRAPSGCAASRSSSATSRDSGNSSATTIAVIRGMSSAIKAIDRMSPQSARLEWRVATVTAIRDETPHARTLVLRVPDWPGHRAGQHVDVRLVAEDGYEAQRSYSIASAPENDVVELTVERIDNAEV